VLQVSPRRRQDVALFWCVPFLLVRTRSAPALTHSPAAPVLALQVRTFLDETARNLPWSTSRLDRPEQEDTPRGSPDALSKAAPEEQDSLGAARSLVACLATFGLDSGADELLAQLGVVPPAASISVGLDRCARSSFSLLHGRRLNLHPRPRARSVGGVSFSGRASSRAPWSISPRATSQRLMQLICVLRVFLNFPGASLLLAL